VMFYVVLPHRKKERISYHIFILIDHKTIFRQSHSSYKMGNFNSIQVPFKNVATASEAEWKCFPLELILVFPFDPFLCPKAWQTEDKHFVQAGFSGIGSTKGVLFKANTATTTNLVEFDIDGFDPDGVTIISAVSAVMSDKSKVVMDKSNPYGAFFEEAGLFTYGITNPIGQNGFKLPPVTIFKNQLKAAMGTATKMAMMTVKMIMVERKAAAVATAAAIAAARERRRHGGGSQLGGGGGGSLLRARRWRQQQRGCVIGHGIGGILIPVKWRDS
jgi:hypothetical protein